MKDGGPAFPVRGGMCFYFPEELRGQMKELQEKIEGSYSGMSLRDWFAGQALMGHMLAADKQEACGTGTDQGFKRVK